MISVPARAEGTPPRIRRRWQLAVRVAAVVVVLAAIGCGLGFWRYAATYAPLSPGGFFGTYGYEGRNVVQRSTDLGEELYVKGPAGTDGQVITALVNLGSHGVTIQRFLRGTIANFQWSPYILRPGGNAFGKPLPLRQLPAYIPPQGQIRVILTLRKPVCEPGGFVNTDYVILYWYALGAHHEYDMPLTAGSPITFVGCPHYIFRRAH